MVEAEKKGRRRRRHTTRRSQLPGEAAIGEGWGGGGSSEFGRGRAGAALRSTRDEQGGGEVDRQRPGTATDGWKEAPGGSEGGPAAVVAMFAREGEGFGRGGPHESDTRPVA